MPPGARRRQRLDPDDAMAIWRARDAYRLQTIWIALCLGVFGLPLLLMLESGHIVVAGGIGVTWWLVQWALPRGLRWLVWQMQDGVRWAGRWSLQQAWRWWRSLLVVVLLGSALAGCQEMNRAMLKLNGCEDQAIEQGYCHMPKEAQR